MDITNIPQALIKGLEQKNTEQLAALSRVLNLVLGKTVIATISSAEPVTPSERTELLKQTTAALAQINQQAINKLTPALKAEISRLVQQQNLIQSPELKWINLVVNNRSLLTYSDRPLVAGQAIPVQLQSPQKLVLLDLPDSESTEATETKLQPTALATTTSNKAPILDSKQAAALNELLKVDTPNLANKSASITATSLIKNPDGPPIEVISKTTPPESNLNKIAAEKVTISNPPLLDSSPQSHAANKLQAYNTKDLPLQFSRPIETKNSNLETTATKTLISEQLRHLLPHRDTPNLLMSAVLQLQQLPIATKAQLFSPSLEQALKSLAEKIRSPEQLVQPRVLAQALKNSGIVFENKLSNLATKEPQEKNIHLNNTYAQDMKGSLLNLLSKVTQELNPSNKPISNEQTLKLFQNLGGAVFSPTPGSSIGTGIKFNTTGDISQTISLLIQELMHKPVKELSNKELRAQLLVLLQQHSVHSLVKIQLQQMHSLNHELDTKDSSTPTASWQLDLPVKHHNEVQHLHLRIDREWIDEKNETEPEKTGAKIKQWSVTLRFDLPTLGEFCAQLAIINTQVSATLWAAREQTFAEVRDHVEGLRKQLESEGIKVKYLLCMRGMPPEKPMALSYSLIDIST